VSQRTPDGGLPRAWRPGQQNAPLGLQTQFSGQGVMLERQRYLGFKRLDHIVHTLQIAPIDLRDFCDFDIARQVLRAEILDEAICIQTPVRRAIGSHSSVDAH